MKPVSCSVCTNTVSPKKRLKCKNNQCKIVCHYKCDQVILSPTVAKTIESYYCKTCRESGDSIVFKKQHRTRSKSPSVTGKSVSDKSIVAQGNSHDSKDVSLNESTSVMNYNIHSKSEVDTNHIELATNINSTKDNSSSGESGPLRNKVDISLGNEEDAKSTNRASKNSLLRPYQPKHSSPGRSKSAPPAERTGKSIEKNAASAKLNKSSNDDDNRIEKQTQTSEENLMISEIKVQVALENKLHEAENQLTSLKEMLAEKSEECTRLQNIVNLRNEQFNLLRVTLKEEVDKKHRYQATLVIRDTHIEKLEQVVEELKAPIFTETISTQTDNCLAEILAQNTMLNHDLNLKDENIKNLIQEKEKLINKNNELQDTIYSHDYQNLVLRNQTEKNYNHERDLEIKEDLIKEISESNEELAKNNQHMKEKLVKITEILQEDQEYPSLPATPGLRENHHNHQDDNRSYRDAAANNRTGNSIDNRSIPRPEDMMSGVSPISSISTQQNSRYDTRSIANSSMRSQRRNSNSNSYTNERKERDEIHKKRKNIIIYGMPEMDNNKQSMDEFIHINRFLGNRNFQKSDIYSIGRIGDKNGDRPRPLKIEFYEITSKINVMRNAYHLKDHRRYSHISIQHDLTRNQLQEFYRLKDEARKRELEDGNRNVIYRVKGPPGNWRITQLSKN